MENIRKLFQRAFVNPMDDLECAASFFSIIFSLIYPAIWRDYDAFENDRNKILAKALLNEFGPKYMAARSFFRYEIGLFLIPSQSRETRNYYENIRTSSLAHIPRGTEKELDQVKLWKSLISFEIDVLLFLLALYPHLVSPQNPQNLDDADLRRRVDFTYSKALVVMYRFPEFWIDVHFF